eukprot:jgi/Tetstr1/449815/TSEL_036879.t1
MASRHQASGRFRMGRHSSSRRFADSAATLLAVLALAAVGSCARDRHLDRHHFVPADIVAEEPTAADVETESYLSSMRTGFKHHAMPHKGAPRGQNYPGRGHAPSAECDLCADSNWLFVLAAGGRTGSTTAMSMFDSVPGFEIGGEHGGVLDHEMHFMDQVVEYSSRPKTATAWKHRPEDLHALRCETQEKMRRLIFGANYRELSARARVVGFKEIRYTTMHQMAFIASVFPCARFVFTYRNQTDVKVTSQGFNKKALPLKWSSVGNLYSHLTETFPHQMAMLPVEDLTPARYNTILHGLLGVRGCSFTDIVHENAGGGYSYTGDGPAEDNLFDGECDLSGVNFALRPETLEHNAVRWAALVEEHQEDQRAAAQQYVEDQQQEEDEKKAEEAEGEV